MLQGDSRIWQIFEPVCENSRIWKVSGDTFMIIDLCVIVIRNDPPTYD